MKKLAKICFFLIEKIASMKDAYITYTSSYLPNHPIANDQIENVLGKIRGKSSRAKNIVLKNNGIMYRYYALDPVSKIFTHTNSELTACALKKILSGAPLKKNDIGGLACGTSTPDCLFPSHASMVQGELKLPPVEIMSSSGVCCSGVSAWKYAWLNVISGSSQNFLVSGSELVSPYMLNLRFESHKQFKLNQLKEKPVFSFNKDFLRWMLSDGAGAFLISNKPSKKHVSFKIEWIDICSYAGNLEPCMVLGAIKKTDGTLKTWNQAGLSEAVRNDHFIISQDVKLLDKHIIDCAVSKTLKTIMKKRKLKPENMDWFLPHYSSKYFKTRLFEQMKKIRFEIPQEKVFTNLYYKGNTGAASIFIILDELFHSNKCRKGQKILCMIPESSRFTIAYVLLTVC